MKVFFAVALIVLATCVAANKPTFTPCGGSLKDVKFEALDDFKGGATVRVKITGTNDKEIKAGYHTYSDVKVFGSNYESTDKDLCSYPGTPFECPVAPGTHTWEFSQVLPSVPFSVPLEADSNWKNPDTNDLLLCFKMAVDVQP